MIDMITGGMLHVKCRFEILSVINCSIHSKYGDHTRTEIKAVARAREDKTALMNISDNKLEITSRFDNNAEEYLFGGLIESVEFKQEGQYATLILKAVSNTWEMDIESKSRSFQDLSMTYRNVAERVIQKYDAIMIWNLLDKPLEHPLVQYKETDFNFLKRILSHLGGNIAVSDIQGRASFNAGIGEGSHMNGDELKGKTYTIVPFHDKSLIGYKIENLNFVRVGDILHIQGQTYYVMETEVKIINNVLNCTCLAFPKQCFEVERIPADTLKGTILTGKVLKTEQEKVKLQLDIDKEQKVNAAYEFPWEPITGNILYSMPEEDSKVGLYFKDGEEKNAAVIYNIRENGEGCEEIADGSNRYFTTQHEKRMYLKPAEIGVVNLTEQNAEISLKDVSGLQIKSRKKISIMANGQIQLKGKRIKMTAPKEATLVKIDIMNPTVINLCNAFDAIGAKGDFTAVSKEKRPRKRKSTGGHPMEKYSLDGVLSTVLSNIPMAEIGNQVMETVAASMPVISRNIR